MSPLPLADQVALVTGASRGIGAAVARSLSAAGAKLLLTYRTGQAEAEALAAELGHAHAVQLDVTSVESIQAAFLALDQRFGRLDILVNNAGYLKQEPFLEITEESYDLTVDTNLKGVFFCTQAAARRFAEQNSGNVINIASVGGQFGGPKAPHYSASKAAVITLTKSCARILGPLGVRVNCISPGFIRTEMISHLLEDGQEQAIASSLPLNRVGETRDIGAAAVYLASVDSSFMTGHTLNINGGQFM